MLNHGALELWPSWSLLIWLMMLLLVLKITMEMLAVTELSNPFHMYSDLNRPVWCCLHDVQWHAAADCSKAWHSFHGSILLCKPVPDGFEQLNQPVVITTSCCTTANECQKTFCFDVCGVVHNRWQQTSVLLSHYVLHCTLKCWNIMLDTIFMLLPCLLDCLATAILAAGLKQLG